MDDSDANWWKGSKGKLEGLFPSNFVTADLSVDPNQLKTLENTSNNKKFVKFSNEVEVKTLKRELDIIEVEINEDKIDQLLHLLHEADPQSDLTDPIELLDLEEQVMAMGPLIDAALEKVDRRHAQLTQLSSDLVDAVNLYRTLQREPQPPPPPQTSYNYQQKITIPMSNQSVYSYGNQQQIPYNHHQVYQRNYGPGIPQQQQQQPGSSVDYTGAMTTPQHYHQQFSSLGHQPGLQNHPVTGINHPGTILQTGHLSGGPGVGPTQHPSENLAYPNPGLVFILQI